ncbi:hypothetical protein KY346_06185 [Candidatus Woesearchaeota archaeon]|nr:hypothetical protein [Candidatus Woesearchaeota archaeon]
MRNALIILLMVVLVAALGFMMPGQTTGMAPTLSQYPTFFGPEFDAVIIKGKTRDMGEITAANLIIERLPDQYMLMKRIRPDLVMSLPPEGLANRVFVEDEIDYKTTDAILVGIPCHNKAIAELLNAQDCRTFFPPGEGFVKLMDKDGHTYLIITGHSDGDVLNAARYFLSALQLGKLDSNQISVSRQAEGTPLRGARTTPSARTTRTDELSALGMRFYIGFE